MSTQEESGFTAARGDFPIWLERGVLVAVLLACGVAISPNVADPDLWGHVQYGRDALRFGLDHTTTYSYAALGHPWMNHENLAEILLAIGADTIGPIGLLIVKFALGLGVIGLVMRQAFRQGAGTLTVAAVALLVAVNLAYHWSLRPQLITYVSYALLLAILSYCFHGWEGEWRLPWGKPADQRRIHYSSARMRWLWLVPPLMCVWTNSHGGFVAGFCIFATYLVLRSLEVLASHGRESLPLIRRFVMMVLAAGLATYVNPYGPNLHRWLLADLLPPRPEITEWHPPHPFDPLTVPFWLLLGAWTLALLGTRRSRDFTQLVVMAVILWQAVSHQRHIAFFSLTFGFWMAPHLQSLLDRLIRSSRDPRPTELATWMRWLLAGGLAAASVLIAGRIVWRLSDMPVPRDEYPVSALQFVADRRLSGKVVCTMNWAQYVLAAVGTRDGREPGLLVHVDGRLRTCYPQRLMDDHFDFILGDGPASMRWRHPGSPPVDPTAVLNYAEPDFVLLCRQQPHAELVMYQQPEWVLLYQDQLAQLWGRRSKFGDAASPWFIPPKQRRITNEPQTGSVTWPAYPRGRDDV